MEGGAAVGAFGDVDVFVGLLGGGDGGLEGAQGLLHGARVAVVSGGGDKDGARDVAVDSVAIGVEEGGAFVGDVGGGGVAAALVFAAVSEGEVLSVEVVEARFAVAAGAAGGLAGGLGVGEEVVASVDEACVSGGVSATAAVVDGVEWRFAAVGSGAVAPTLEALAGGAGLVGAEDFGVQGVCGGADEVSVWGAGRGGGSASAAVVGVGADAGFAAVGEDAVAVGEVGVGAGADDAGS